MADSDADGHGEEDPEGEEAIEEGELFARHWCAGLGMGIGGAGHHYLEAELWEGEIAVGGGAPWRLRNFAGVQQALVRRQRSACMAFSC